MAVNFFNNGSSLGSTAGWGGFTGSNNYVVRYSFTTGSSGASSVTLSLSSIYTQKGSGGQSWGFKISTSSTQYANARGIVPDSNEAYMSFNGSWGCTLTASGLNLSPNTTYYLFVYITSAGTEYYGGTWNCTDPGISTSGSYTPTSSSISSISSSVLTQNRVTIQMNNPGGLTHTCKFYYGTTLLATSGSFTNSLSYVCPRSWFSYVPSDTEMSITAKVTGSTGSTDQRSFVLVADSGMVPNISSAISITPINGNSVFDDFISNASRIKVSLDADSIDWSAAPGAEVRNFKITYNNVSANHDVTGDYDLQTGIITGSGSVLCVVTDSRGRTGSTTLSFEALYYVEPYLSSYYAIRCNPDGTASETGSCYKIKAVSECTTLSGRNSATITYAIRRGAEDYGPETEISSNTELIISATLFPNSTYRVRFTVSDTVGISKTYVVTLAFQAWAIKFYKGGSGVAFGKAAENRNALEIANGWNYIVGDTKISDGTIENVGKIILESPAYGSSFPSSPKNGQLFFLVAE